MQGIGSCGQVILQIFRFAELKVGRCEPSWDTPVGLNKFAQPSCLPLMNLMSFLRGK